MTDKVKYKQVQILNFFLAKAGGKETKMKLYKLTWLADKFHLLNYGNFLSDDVYCVMEYGIVPSNIRNITLEENTYDILSVAGRTVSSLQSFDSSVFNENELGAMESVWKKFGKCSASFLSSLSHEYPEYLRFKDTIETYGGREWVVIKDFFKIPENSNSTMSDFFNFDEEYLQFLYEDYIEQQEVLKALQDQDEFLDRELQRVN